MVDGYAVGYYGYPRFTGVLDIWIRPDIINARQVISALSDFGFPTHQLTEEYFSRNDVIFQIGYRPQRIDILTSLDGVSFDACYIKREKLVTADCEINMISLEDLIINKKATGCYQDLSDIENLEKNLKR